MEMFRQGDVLLVKVDKIPKGAKDVTPDDRIVLAYGEVTGHAHAIYEPQTKNKPLGKAKIFDFETERFLRVMEQTALKHEEHTEIPLPAGDYKVIRQKEYSPERDRLVAD